MEREQATLKIQPASNSGRGVKFVVAEQILLTELVRTLSGEEKRERGNDGASVFTFGQLLGSYTAGHEK